MAQPEHVVGKGGNHGDGEYHRCRSQKQWCTPAIEPYRGRHLDPGGKERNQHRHFGQHFQQCRFPERVEVKDVEQRWPDEQADQQIDDRRGHRQTA